jgi:hypothetical protein
LCVCVEWWTKKKTCRPLCGFSRKQNIPYLVDSELPLQCGVFVSAKICINSSVSINIIFTYLFTANIFCLFNKLKGAFVNWKDECDL